MLASVTAERTTEQLGLSRLDAEGKASEWLEAANSHTSTTFPATLSMPQRPQNGQTNALYADA